MTSDIDIYRSARLLIDQHGDEAAIRAADGRPSCRMPVIGSGAATWRRTLVAVCPTLSYPPILTFLSQSPGLQTSPGQPFPAFSPVYLC